MLHSYGRTVVRTGAGIWTREAAPFVTCRESIRDMSQMDIAHTRSGILLRPLMTQCIPTIFRRSVGLDEAALLQHLKVPECRPALDP